MVVEPTASDTALGVMCKRHDGSLYLFVANMTPQKAAAKLRLLDPQAASSQAVTIEEANPIAIRDGQLDVELDGYGIGLYRVRGE